MTQARRCHQRRADLFMVHVLPLAPGVTTPLIPAQHTVYDNPRSRFGGVLLQTFGLPGISSRSTSSSYSIAEGPWAGGGQWHRPPECEMKVVVDIFPGDKERGWLCLSALPLSIRILNLVTIGSSTIGG
ncbi:hypothetical protein FA13DRAFT_1794991 [Coprinellus micaceus]|uniref:Uncharacterized protein n=1 Tax=Coprinellus micaceus TaxID=71717 RepID=A0A4Y7SJZ3_COPMI|nr:hypothetical protein FA13DRAFT_1799072 [Coprinellus micaceus]TEB27179.1 hypothetical protein FA13DRAFT_1794991 [Coprinellus micaceus]